MVDDNLKLFKK